MFRAGLLRIIRRYLPVYTAVGICHAFMLTGCWLLEIAETGKEIFSALTNSVCGYFLQHRNLLSERPANSQST
jgi:hypothetical protein